MKLKRTILIIFIFTILSSFTQTNKYESGKFKTKSISVFKNGTAFFLKESEFNINNNKNLLVEQPIKNMQAIFGSVWFNSFDNKIKKIGTYTDTVKTTVSVENTYEILEANKGKTLNLTLYNYEKPITATISLLNNDILLLKTKTEWISTKVSNVKHIGFNEKPNTKHTKKEVKDLLSIDFEKSTKNQKVQLMYMQNGLIWTPNYYIRTGDNNKAYISLKANVMNDIEDIENTDLNFVVGVPSFSFSHVNSTFTSKQTVANFLNTLNNRNFNSYNNNITTNSITTQSMYNFAPENRSSGYENNSELTGKGSSDEGLFFYNVNNVNLKKGERAFFDILETEVEYEQIYSVELSGNENIYNNYKRNYSNNENKTENPVWHSIRFKNNTKMPFTTGTAFIMKKNNNMYKPVSQNYLYYTPTGVMTTVKTTISPDISVVNNEKEISRKENAIKYHDLITIEGEIVIENFKNKDVKIEVKKLITGELISSNTKNKSTSQLKTWNSINKQNDTRWDDKIKSNGKKTITYKYKIYVRR